MQKHQCFQKIIHTLVQSPKKTENTKINNSEIDGLPSSIIIGKTHIENLYLIPRHFIKEQKIKVMATKSYLPTIWFSKHIGFETDWCWNIPQQDEKYLLSFDTIWYPRSHFSKNPKETGVTQKESLVGSLFFPLCLKALKAAIQSGWQEAFSGKLDFVWIFSNIF